MKQFNGKMLFLDRSDINTDEIIPAKYLTAIDKASLTPHLLEDLDLAGFDPQNDLAGKNVIVSRANFGCGSSREHAVWALEMNQIHLVIAESFARIFRQNMFNCGMLAVELDRETIDALFAAHAAQGATLQTSINPNCFRIQADGKTTEVPFSLSEFDQKLIEAGGWVEYADAKY